MRLTDEEYMALKGRVTEGRASGGTTEHIHRRKPSDLTPGGATSTEPLGRQFRDAVGKRSASSNASPHFTFTLLGQIPSGKNSIKTTRTGKRYPTKRFVEWRDVAVNGVQASRAYLSNPGWAGTPLFPKPSTLCIEIRYAAGDLRRRDMPGMMDALYHVLEKAQIVEDDAQIQECHWYQLPLNREQPGVTVTLKERRP